jgi:6-phospho-beta-glucosidase
MKIAIIGGGSSYTPELIEGLILRRDLLPISHVALVDVPAGEEKLRTIRDLTCRMFEKANLPVQVTAGYDRREALKDCSYVITQFRVGRLEARAKDESIPLKYNTLGQETTGPGGFAKALRTIPVILDIARDMEALCPDAWLVNFTNPSGIITEAVLKHTAIRSIGLCNAPINMYRNLVSKLQLTEEAVSIRYVGLNHLSWISRIYVHGQDKTNALFSDPDFASYAASLMGGQTGNQEIARIMKLIPSYYLNYFYNDRISVEKERKAIQEGKGTRADQVMAVEKELFELYANPDLKEKPAQLSQRGGALYSEAALSLIQSLHNNEGKMHIVNVMNQGAISDLPGDCVVETNCLVDKTGARPIASGPLPSCVASLTKTVKDYEQLTIQAAVTGCRDTAYLALLNHPLVHSAADALHLLHALLDAHQAYLPQFFKEGV